MFNASGLRRIPHGLAHIDGSGNEIELGVAVGDRLLRRENILGDRPDHEGRAPRGNRLNLEVDPGDVGERLADEVTIAFRPFRRAGERSDDVAQDDPVIFCKIAIGDEERVCLGDFMRVDENARVLLDLGNGEVRIPDRPGIDRAVGESRAGFRRTEIDRRDVAE